MQREDLPTTKDGGVIMCGDFLELMGRAATSSGITGDDRALQWMRRHGVSGERATLSPAEFLRLAEIATPIIRRRDARNAKRYPLIPPPEPIESTRRAGQD